VSHQPTQADRLRDAINETRLSRRRLAQLLLGEEASEQQIASKKSQITKWLGGKPGISDLNALELARAFNEASGFERYEATHFFKSNDRRPEWADEVARIAEERERDRAAYQEEIRKLREELETTRQEILYEIDRAKEAS